jgi:hypothetical protein
MLAANRQLTHKAFALLLGVNEKSLTRLRQRHDEASPGRASVRTSPGRWPKNYVPKHPAMMKPIAPDELAAIPPGEQPVINGHLICLSCGRRFFSLLPHLGLHGLDAAAYRERHGLAPEVTLRREPRS